jgi:hypothetical protein
MTTKYNILYWNFINNLDTLYNNVLNFILNNYYSVYIHELLLSNSLQNEKKYIIKNMKNIVIVLCLIKLIIITIIKLHAIYFLL